MQTEPFNLIVDQRCEKIRKVLASKAGEYTRGDRFSNFIKAAGAQGISPEEALLGMWMKHIVSITDFVQDIGKGKVAPYEVWDEKIGDAINYLVILDGIIQERLEKEGR